MLLNESGASQRRRTEHLPKRHLMSGEWHMIHACYLLQGHMSIGSNQPPLPGADGAAYVTQRACDLVSGSTSLHRKAQRFLLILRHVQVQIIIILANTRLSAGWAGTGWTSTCGNDVEESNTQCRLLINQPPILGCKNLFNSSYGWLKSSGLQSQNPDTEPFWAFLPSRLRTRKACRKPDSFGFSA